MLQPICDKIGDTFGFITLDAIIYRTCGDHRINEYASDQVPRRQMAYACVTGLERDGFVVTFLAHILAMVPGDSTLHVLIITALPEAQTAIKDIEPQISEIIEGLRRTRAYISDPVPAAALKQSQAVLELLERCLTLLDCYKGFHDCLHGVLLGPFAQLLASMRAIARNDWQQLPSLREYGVQLFIAAQLARTIEERLPEEGMVRSIEKKWIDALEEVGNIYRKALKQQNAALAKVAVIKLSIVLKNQSPRLNDYIVEAAKTLPLEKLRSVLVKLVGNDMENVPEISKAIVAIANLEIALRSRVAEHDMWQAVDQSVWYLDDLFTQSPHLFEDFTAFWPEVRSSIRTLADLSPTAEWSVAILGDSALVDQELLSYDLAKTAAQDGSLLSHDLDNTFGALRSEARMRFFVVDQALKRDCARLIELSGPTKQILMDLSHG